MRERERELHILCAKELDRSLGCYFNGLSVFALVCVQASAQGLFCPRVSRNLLLLRSLSFLAFMPALSPVLAYSKWVEGGGRE